MCVCLGERESVCVKESVSVCARVSVHVCVCACVSVCVCACAWEQERVSACVRVVTHSHMQSFVFGRLLCGGQLTLQHTATHCNTLQHTAPNCNALQYTTTYCNTYLRVTGLWIRAASATHCFTLLHTATCCNLLQHTATHCNTLQHTATHCNTLQHTATHCNTLQHTFLRATSLRRRAALLFSYLSKTFDVNLRFTWKQNKLKKIKKFICTRVILLMSSCILFMCVTWHIHMWHEFFIFELHFTYMCDMTYSYVTWTL